MTRFEAIRGSSRARARRGGNLAHVSGSTTPKWHANARAAERRGPTSLAAEYDEKVASLTGALQKARADKERADALLSETEDKLRRALANEQRGQRAISDVRAAADSRTRQQELDMARKEERLRAELEAHKQAADERVREAEARTADANAARAELEERLRAAAEAEQEHTREAERLRASEERTRQALRQAELCVEQADAARQDAEEWLLKAREAEERATRELQAVRAAYEERLQDAHAERAAERRAAQQPRAT